MVDLKNKLRDELETSQTEEIGLQVFKREREKLTEEKDSVAEVLRHIHGDLNSMDSVIKQTEAEKRKRMEMAKLLISEFKLYKNNVDQMRTSFGMAPLEDDNSLDADLQEQIGDLASCTGSGGGVGSGGHLSKLGPLMPSDWPPNEPIREGMFGNCSTGFMSKIGAKGSAGKLSVVGGTNSATGGGGGGGGSLSFGQHGTAGNNASPQFNQNRQNSDPINQPLANQQRKINLTAAFGQQPPPMKSCQSCAQQIHRNAPICPYCKSKSRSRNPKKPKKKLLN